MKKPPVPRFTKDNFFISRPTVPMVEQFYEKYIKDEQIIAKGIAEGKFVQGTLYFDKELSNKWDAYVTVPGLPQAVKVRGLKYLNRALHLDTVVLKFVNWVQWEKAQPSLTKNIDFSETAEDDPYQTGLFPTQVVAKDEAASDEKATTQADSTVGADEESKVSDSEAGAASEETGNTTGDETGEGDDEEAEEEAEEEQYYDE